MAARIRLALSAGRRARRGPGQRRRNTTMLSGSTPPPNEPRLRSSSAHTSPGLAAGVVEDSSRRSPAGSPAEAVSARDRRAAGPVDRLPSRPPCLYATYNDHSYGGGARLHMTTAVRLPNATIEKAQKFASQATGREVGGREALVICAESLDADVLDRVLDNVAAQAQDWVSGKAAGPRPFLDQPPDPVRRTGDGRAVAAHPKERAALVAP